MTHFKLILLSLLCWWGSTAFGQIIIYQQNFDGNNGSFANTIVSQSGTNGWFASSTAAQYGNYRHVWNFSNTTSGGNANALPISGRSLGMGFYNGNNPNVSNQFFRTWDGTNCNVIPLTTRWAHVGVSTVGYQNITVEFKWRCTGEVDGGTVYDYGTVNTSIDGGTTWLMDQTGGQGGTTGAHGAFAGGLYYGNSGVLTQTISLPANRNDQPNFRLAFRMVVDECYGTGGGFIIDDIIIRGTPISSCVAGTASGPAYVPTNNTANLTLANYSGSTIQWQVSPNGSTGWANVTTGNGGNTASYTTAALGNGTYYYRAVVTDGGSCTDNSNVVTVVVAATPPYCSGVGSGNAFSNNHLESIAFHEWSDPNPGNFSNNYLDYTDTVDYGYATVVAGQYHHLNALIRANGIGANGTTFAYWVDWNGDGTFNNNLFSSGGERMDNQFYTSTVGNTYAGYFTVPSTAAGLVRVRMRVVRGNQGTLDPCNAYINSQTKDFMVKILPSIGNTVCNGVNGNANNVSTNSTTDKVYISRVNINGPNGTVIDNNGMFFGVQAGTTITMYNYSNFMGSYSNGLVLEAGTQYTASIEHSGYTTAAGLFIDYNGDGDFADANELVGRISDPNANPFIFTFTVPGNITNGQQVAMRVRLFYDDNGSLGNVINSCNNINTGFGIYSEVEDYRVTLSVPTLACAPVSNLAASIGTPANGTAHHLDVSWTPLSGATGYDLEYSTSSNSGPWTTLGTVTGNSYDFNAGDSPNTPYYFRIRAKDGSQTCAWATMSAPRYTAADVPAIPTLSNVGSTIDVTLPNETPVNNPASTTYSIKDENTGLFVQANGTLGATEVFQTKAQWGTVTVNGLSSNTQYCFVAKARNNDGHEVGGSGATLLAEQGFNTSGTLSTTGGSGSTATWWSPSSCGSGGLTWNASNGCTGGAVGQSTTTPFCFVRSPAINCTGQNTVVMTFDISHSYFASLTTDQVNFNMWAPTASAPTGQYIDAARVNGVAGDILFFNQARSCQQVTVEFDLGLVTDKSAILFYFNTFRPGSSSNTYYMWVDNVKFSEATQTACATTTTCVAGTWTGLAGDNDWNNPANWSCNTIPTASIDVSIPAGVSTYPILATALGNPTIGYVRDITIAANANITISGGGNTLEVNRNLTNNGAANLGAGALRLTNSAAHTVNGNINIGTLTVEANTAINDVLNISEALNLVSGVLNTNNGTVTLESNASTTAYIDDFSAGHSGSINGNVTVERYVANTVNGFHYVGTPVNGANFGDWAADFTMYGSDNAQVIPLTNCDPNALAQGSPYGGLFDYRENTVTDCYLSGWHVRNGNGNISRAQGFAGIIPNGRTIDLTGTANTGPINSGPLTRSAQNLTSTQGMHLISNPYPSALDWYDVAAANSGIDGTAYLWLTSGGYQGTYQPINALAPNSSFIGSSQGFFVEALSNGTQVNFNNTMRATGNNSFFRQGQAFDSRLILEVSGNGYNDMTIVAFGTDFTHGYDRDFDGKKMQSKAGVMTLYTHTNTSYPRQSTNALPNDRSVKVVPVGFAAGANGTFTFNATDLGTFAPGTLIFLEDLKTGHMQNLMLNAQYTFHGEDTDGEARFLLHFIPGIEWNTVAASCIGNDGSLVVDLGASQINGTVITWDNYEIVNQSGNEIANGHNANGTINLNNLAPGTYTVTLEHDGYTVVQDITITGAPLVDALVAPSDTEVIVGEIIAFTNTSQGASSYAWDFGDGNTSTDANPAYSYTAEGTYTVTLTATNGTCTDVFTQTIIVAKVQDPTGITELADGAGLQIFGYGRTITVRFENWRDGNAQLELYDLTGRKVIDTQTLNTAQAEHRITVDEVVTGYYFVHVTGASGSQVARVFLGE